MSDRSSAAVLPPTEPPPLQLSIVGPAHPQRTVVESFVERRFATAYQAKVRRHYGTIAAISDQSRDIIGAAGVRFAEDEPLFLERYFDEPVEQALAHVFGRPVARDQVVEIGAFAAAGAEPALALFGGLSSWLTAACHRCFAVATARPELERLLARAGFALRSLGPADPARLGPDAQDWGSYYLGAPQVFAGEIGGSRVLPELRRRLRAASLARQARRVREGRA